jgi:hypothetical protein
MRSKPRESPPLMPPLNKRSQDTPPLKTHWELRRQERQELMMPRLA